MTTSSPGSRPPCSAPSAAVPLSARWSSDVVFEEDALTAAVGSTQGHPYFLQVVGDHLWRMVPGSPVTLLDVERVQPLVTDHLDRGFSAFHTERLPIAQRRYLRAVAEAGQDDVASGEITAVLGMRSSPRAGRTRDALIRKGLICSPRLGYAAFTAPRSDDHLRGHLELERHEPRRRDGS